MARKYELKRRAVRQELSHTLVDELEARMCAERPKLSRSNDLAKAMDYMLKRWEAFTRFLDDGRICLTNNAAERALRGVAMGRKAWLEATNASTRFPPGTDPGLLEWYANEMGKSDVEVMCGLYGLLRHASAASFLKKIRAPVLGLYPTGGPITSREQEEQLATGIPQMKFIHVPTAFHSVLTLLPATCASHVLHFAAAHDGIACREQ